jgi:hypothetical protein
VNANVPAEPAAKVAWAAFVNLGASKTSSVKLCVAFAPTPFDAVKVIG